MHHYTECGLDNIWLADGYIERETPYGHSVAVEHVDELHEFIARMLVEDKPQLTGREFRFLRKFLEMPQRHLAAIVGNNEQSIANWEKGDGPPPWGDRIIRVLVLNKLRRDADLERLVHVLEDHAVRNVNPLHAEFRLAWRANLGWRPHAI